VVHLKISLKKLRSRKVGLLVAGLHCLASEASNGNCEQKELILGDESCFSPLSYSVFINVHMNITQSDDTSDHCLLRTGVKLQSKKGKLGKCWLLFNSVNVIIRLLSKKKKKKKGAAQSVWRLIYEQDDRGSFHRRENDRNFFSLPRRPNRLCGPSSPLSTGKMAVA
jgi:hypothetical protein